MGELRYGVDDTPPWKDTVYKWYHLICVAEKLPYRLRFWLSRNRKKLPPEVLEAMYKASQKKTSPLLPYAVITKNSKAKCTVCGDPIRKGEFLVMLDEPKKHKPRPPSRRRVTRRRAATKEPPVIEAAQVQVHPGCVSAAAKSILKVNLTQLKALLKPRCPNLTKPEFEDLSKQLK